MRSTRKNGFIMAVIALVAIMVMGTTAVSAGLGNFNSDLPFLAQNGNGNGGRSGENPPNPPGTGNDGQGQGAEHGNPPADPGAGNNRQGEGNADAPEDAGAEDATAEDAAADEDAAEEPQAAPVNPAPEKLEVCHVTGTGDSVLITISSRAIPAHQRHGDTEIGEGAEAECGETADDGAALDGTPVPGDEDDDDADETDAGTPAASPMASPETDEDND